MPAPVIPDNKYLQLSDNHSAIYWQRFNALYQAYSALNTYNPTGAGSMPSLIEWRIPNTNYFLKYDPGSYSEIVINNTLYASATPSEKRLMFKYLDAFFKYCLLQYDQYYNL